MGANSYIGRKVDEYIGDLAARKATPGGGSAAALSAAIGAGLNMMVINFTKTDDRNVQKGFIEARERQSESLSHLSSLVDKDCEVFTSLMAALSGNKDPKEEYIAAATVPMQICRECHVSLNITLHLVESGNRNLITDVGCAGHILSGAFFASEYNVMINLRHINDQKFYENAEKTLGAMKKDVIGVSREIAYKVGKILAPEVL